MSKILQGNRLDILRTLDSDIADTCITCPTHNIFDNIAHSTSDSDIQKCIDNVVDVFREVRRVLNPDGTLWVIADDLYNSNISSDFIKKSDLVGLPWMLAFALRSDGWYLRQDIICKIDMCSDDIEDRCVNSHRYIFLLSNERNYYFDYEAIQEYATGYDGRKDTTHKGSEKYSSKLYFPNGTNNQSMASSPHERWRYKNLMPKGQPTHTMHEKRLDGYSDEVYPIRNKRNVWDTTDLNTCISAGSKFNGVIIDPFYVDDSIKNLSEDLGRDYIGIKSL